MINYIGCFVAFILGLVLSEAEFIGNKQIQILTILGFSWVITLYFIKGGI